MKKITPVILAGGSGTRLWPVSRKTYPKQFSKLLGEESLFQQSINRVSSQNNADFSPPVVITNNSFRFIVSEQLNAINQSLANILVEPEGKDTAPAILAATIFATLNDARAIVLALPSDHVISDITKFNQTVRRGLEFLDNGKIITFGIKPTHAATGYGYIKFDTATKAVIEFVEKPAQMNAEEMLLDGKYLWNAGIFLYRAIDLISAFKTYQPDILDAVTKAVENIEQDLNFHRLDPDSWSKSPAISIDYGIMEKAKNLGVVNFNGNWSDLGDWSAVHSELASGSSNLALTENAYQIECEDTILHANSPSQTVVGLGLKNIVAVAMQDAVLVADKSKSQEVKKVVETLKNEKIQQAEIFPKDHRPWGWFEILATSDRFQVKRIVVNPGEELSLQSHIHRSEHWIVVAGTAEVMIDKEVKLVSEGESVFVPLGAIHRMSNPGKMPMTLIEVQTGSYLGEDDIKRYKDKYSRS